MVNGLFRLIGYQFHAIKTTQKKTANTINNYNMHIDS